ncbi:evr1_Alr domain-containing protein Alr [Lycorma delicatula]|uniref:evr1_Alr domain-containing protein Alr n=1 Tax=Lycorma delicatula TaxID=130591 RepID=UPI003F5152B8
MSSRLGADYSEPHENGKKACRTCTDFKSWAKLHTEKPKNDGNPVESKEQQAYPQQFTKRPPADCPLDRDQLGSKTWAFLHTMAAYYPDRPSIQQQRDMVTFFTIFSRFYPCEACAEHFRNQLRASPPMVQSQEALTQWLCWVHNNVNRRLGKPQFDCRLVNERWRDGWPDGSCDF